MLKQIFIKLCCLFFVIVSVSFAQDINIPIANIKPPAITQPKVVTQPNLVPAPPTIDAKAYVLMDANSGKILAQKNMNQKLPPASLTKMMTLYLSSRAIANGQINLDDKVLISKKAWKMGGSKMFIRVGQQIPVRDLLQGIIVDSGNDSCVAMSEFIAGSEDAFIPMMNQEAKTLGMNNTHYADCTGLSIPNHFSTAYDLATLARHIINDYPQYYGWYKQKWYKFNGIRQPNRNRLLWRYQYADGLKTGHTDQAGFCLVSSAVKDGMRLISVVLGTPTDEARSNTSIKLLEYGFRFYESHLLFQANSPIVNPRVWYGQTKTVSAGVANDFYVNIPRGQYDKIKVNIKLDHNITAPITQGQTIGTLTATLDDQVMAEAPVIALNADPNGGIFRKSWDHIGHLFHGWFAPKQK